MSKAEAVGTLVFIKLIFIILTLVAFQSTLTQMVVAYPGASGRARAVVGLFCYNCHHHQLREDSAQHQVRWLQEEKG